MLDDLQEEFGDQAIAAIEGAVARRINEALASRAIGSPAWYVQACFIGMCACV